MTQRANPFERATTVASMTSWFGLALDRYFHDEPPADPWAFESAARHIGRHPSLEADIAAIYESLSADKQMQLRHAVKNLLAQRGRTSKYRASTLFLIDLSVLMGSSDSLAVLPGLVAGTTDNKLYDRVVTAAIHLSRQTDAALRCIRQLRTSPHFSPTYACLLLNALCHIDPDNWVEHVADLNPAIEALQPKLPPRSRALHLCAEEILAAISLIRLCADIGALVERFRTPCDNWLWSTLFEGKRSVLVWHRPSGTLALRAAPEVSATANLDAALRSGVVGSERVENIHDQEQLAVTLGPASAALWQETRAQAAAKGLVAAAA